MKHDKTALKVLQFVKKKILVYPAVHLEDFFII